MHNPFNSATEIPSQCVVTGPAAQADSDILPHACIDDDTQLSHNPSTTTSYAAMMQPPSYLAATFTSCREDELKSVVAQKPLGKNDSVPPMRHLFPAIHTLVLPLFGDFWARTEVLSPLGLFAAGVLRTNNAIAYVLAEKSPRCRMGMW